MTRSAHYARAILEVRRGGKLSDAELLRNVREALRRRHHEKLLPKVFEEYKKLEEKEERHTVLVRVHHEREKGAALAAVKELGVDAAPRVVVDPTLIRGYTIQGRDWRTDASAKRALIELYKKLITG